MRLECLSTYLGNICLLFYDTVCEIPPHPTWLQYRSFHGELQIPNNSTTRIIIKQSRHCLMAYSHCQTQIRTRTRIQIPNLMVTLYYVEIFTLVQIWIWIPVWRVSQIVTVPILGTDIHSGDRCPSLFHTFQSGDQSLDPNQCEISA